MSGLLSYSGIITKTRAMQKNIIPKADYEKIANMETTSDLINYLRNNPSYTDLLRNRDERGLHRSQAEQILADSIYLDFAKLYRFANQSQRKVLSLIFFRFEVSILKSCLRNVFSSDTTYDLLLFEPFFLKHSDLKVKELASSQTIEEFISYLGKTQYFDLFKKLQETNHTTLQDFQVQLDIYYFKKIWKLKDHIISGKNLKVVTMIYGTQIDLLNLLWIYRSKKFYDIETGKILANIIPINYKLSKHELIALVEAISIEDFMKIVQNTYYGKLNDATNPESLELLYLQMYQQLYDTCSTKFSTSMAPVLRFLYLKELELDMLTTSIECIRYKLRPGDILHYLKL